MMKRKLHELTLAELEKRVKRTRLGLCVMSLFFMGAWLVTYLFGYAVDPLVGWMCLTMYLGFIMLFWGIVFLQEYLVWFLRLAMGEKK